MAIPGEAVRHHHYSMRLSIPFPDQNRAGTKLLSLLVKAGKTDGHCWFFLLANHSIEHLLGWVIEITEAICLEPIGDDRKQQMPR